MKTLVVVTWLRECDVAPFAACFAPYPHVRLWDARVERKPWPDANDGEAAGLLLTGGSDIDAPFLRQPVPDPRLVEEPDPARDAWEFAAVERALSLRLPLFAICRGMQVLNVALGGTLHLDIPGHRGEEQKFGNLQPLRYAPGVPAPFPHVNSSHHQALDRLGAGLRAEAWHAGDGVVEQVRLDALPFGLGVQYHPERDPLYRPLFDAFVAALS